VPAVLRSEDVLPLIAPTVNPGVATLALILYPNVGMLDGRHAHNAWLHELPDPVTKVTWDNYACVSPATAAQLGIQDGDVVRVTPVSLESGGPARADGPTVELPTYVQPGQADATVAIAVGYGRSGTDRFARVGPPWVGAQSRPGLVGVNASALVGVKNNA